MGNKKKTKVHFVSSPFISPPPPLASCSLCTQYPHIILAPWTPASSDNIKVTMALGAKLGEKPSTLSSPRWSRRIWEQISLNSCEPRLLPLAHG